MVASLPTRNPASSQRASLEYKAHSLSALVSFLDFLSVFFFNCSVFSVAPRSKRNPMHMPGAPSCGLSRRLWAEPVFYFYLSLKLGIVMVIESLHWRYGLGLRPQRGSPCASAAIFLKWSLRGVILIIAALAQGLKLLSRKTAVDHTTAPDLRAPLRSLAHRTTHPRHPLRCPDSDFLWTSRRSWTPLTLISP
jgi:hypothetical protein